MNLQGINSNHPLNLPALNSSPETRETALLELSKMREKVEQLAPMLWHSFGTIAVLLQEIVGVYHAIDPATLTPNQVTFQFQTNIILILVKSSLQRPGAFAMRRFSSGYSSIFPSSSYPSLSLPLSQHQEVNFQSESSDSSDFAGLILIRGF